MFSFTFLAVLIRSAEIPALLAISTMK